MGWAPLTQDSKNWRISEIKTLLSADMMLNTTSVGQKIWPGKDQRFLGGHTGPGCGSTDTEITSC